LDKKLKYVLRGGEETPGLVFAAGDVDPVSIFLSF